jgi:spermidine synthase
LKPVVGVLLNAAVFFAAVRLVPGLLFQAGRSVPRIGIVVLIAGVVAVLLIGVISRRVDRSMAGGLDLRGWTILGVGVGLGEAGLLVALSLLSPPLASTFRIGDLPGALTTSSIVSLVTASGVLAVGAIVVDRASTAIGAWLDARAAGAGRLLFGSASTNNGGVSRVPFEGRRLAVVAIFVLSGAAGLMYEVVWSRQLVLVFGNTTQAVSAILTGYFGGLAIGAVLGGRLADRSRRPLRLYGLLEIALVAVVLMTPLLFRGLHELYRAGYGSLESQPTVLALVRYGLALLALAPATILMGATLPTLSRYLSSGRAGLGTAFGWLYTANTIGAISGTILAGIVLIELFGLTGALVIGASGSAVAGIAALLLDRGEPRAAGAGPRAAESLRLETADGAQIAEAGHAGDFRGLSLVVAFISGVTSLGYQVLWTRLLASGSGNTTYVFTLILAVFLTGIAIGAAVVSSRTQRARSTVAALGTMQVVSAAIVVSGLVILSGHLSWLPFVVRVVLVVLPATLAMGVALPLASRLVSAGERHIGRDAGLLLGANTIGSILGTFFVPFILIPTIGSPRSVVVLLLLNLGLGLVLLARGSDMTARLRTGLRTAAIALAAIAVVGLIVPNQLVRDPGAIRLERETNLFAEAEDEIAAVQAGGLTGRPQLLVGGTGMTVLTVDAKLMAYLPIMTRPESERMLVIAFGMGSSYRAGLRAGLRVDGVELVPSVPDMFGYFYPDAAEVRADPRGRLIITDGRNYVELTDRTYDIIVVDPPPPIESSGTSVLYSREFYATSAARLTEAGVMMEWMPNAQSVDEFRAHVRTFADVFPYTLLAFGPTKRGVYMLGSNHPIALDAANVREVLGRPGVLDDLVNTADAPVTTAADWAATIQGTVWIEDDAVRAFGAGAPLILDDRPVTEYFFLRSLFGRPSPVMSEENLRAVTPGP